MLGYKPFVFSFGGHAFIQLLPKLRGSHHCSKPNVHVRLPCCWAQQTTPGGEPGEGGMQPDYKRTEMAAHNPCRIGGHTSTPALPCQRHALHTHAPQTVLASIAIHQMSTPTVMFGPGRANCAAPDGQGGGGWGVAQRRRPRWPCHHGQTGHACGRWTVPRILVLSTSGASRSASRTGTCTSSCNAQSLLGC